MARRSVQPDSPPLMPAKNRSVSDNRRGIERVQERIRTLKGFSTSAMRVSNPPEIAGMEVDIRGMLSRIFGEDTAEYRRFQKAAELQWSASMAFGDYPALHDYQKGIQENIDHAVVILEQAMRFLEEEIADQEQGSVEPPKVGAITLPKNKVFVVHGHDEGAREAVARFLERLGIKPIILHEQANQGRTVMEKIEAHGDVSFAVVLLTPDDEGCVKGGSPKPRARQNVLLELGYFVGRLGRKHVCALKRGDLELPSDFAGVVYEPFDGAGAWKTALGRELQEAGFAFDWNMVMRP